MAQGAKTPWSRPTRARMVALGDLRLTFLARNLNQVVAAGPKTAGRVISVLSVFWVLGEGEFEGGFLMLGKLGRHEG